MVKRHYVARYTRSDETLSYCFVVRCNPDLNEENRQKLAEQYAHWILEEFPASGWILESVEVDWRYYNEIT